MHWADSMETRDHDRYDWMTLDTDQERVPGLMHNIGAFDFNSMKRSWMVHIWAN